MKIDETEYSVSVILTLFNSKKYYTRAIESLLKQNFKDFEVILVDDGSIDGTEEALMPFLKNNSNYKYIRHSNRKHPLSLNTGIKCSSGKFITFLDSDDEYLPDHLAERLKYLNDNPDADLIYSQAFLIGNEEDFWVPDAEDNNKLIHLNDCIIGGTFFGKRKMFEEMNGFNNVYSHDFDFYNRVIESGNYKVVKIDSSTYKYYRNNPDSIISKLKRIH